MSLVKEVLNQFALSSERSAIILKGKWGVGKTFLWDGVIKQRKEKLDTPYYSYVSLFGLTSLKELKQAIYENLMKKEHAADSGGVRSVEDRLEGVISFLRRNSKLVSGIKGAAPLVDSYQASAISDALICIDDFERKSKGLTDGEVLGLISMLVEKRRCKVVLILNEEEIEDKDSEFSEYREKVFSYEVEYRPTSLETANIVFGDEGGYKDLIDKVVRLNITNVRLIRKVKYYFDYLRGQVETQNARLWKDISTTIPLAVLARYGESISPITLEDLEHFDGAVDALFPDASEAETKVCLDKEAQAQLLRKYGYLFTSDLDREIINLVRQGYIDAAAVVDIVTAAERQAEAADAEYEFRVAWMDYHNNFSKSQGEIFKGFEKATDSCLKYLTVDRLGGVVRLYRDMKMDVEADALIERYFSHLTKVRSLPSREELWDEPKDVKIIRALDVYFSSFGGTKSFREAIEYLLSHSSNEESVAVLLKSSSEDIVDYLTSPDTIDFKQAVKFLLSAGCATNDFDNAIPGSAKSIFVNTYEALRKIQSISPLNEHRLAPLMTMDQLYESYKSTV